MGLKYPENREDTGALGHGRRSATATFIPTM